MFSHLLYLGTLVSLQVTTMRPSRMPEKVRMCYFTNWSQYRRGSGRFTPKDIVPSLCTHILFAFAHINTDANSLQMSDWNDAQSYQMITRLKAVEPGLKVLLAVGGATMGTAAFETVAGSQARTEEFTVNAINFLRQNQFDGLDLDWEFPSPETRRDFQGFVQILSTGFMMESMVSRKVKLQLTVAVSGDPAVTESNYGPREIIDYVEYVILMAYDLWNVWSHTLGHHSPLHAVIPAHKEQGRFSVHKLVREWRRHGATADKLVLGLATYGRTGILTSARQHSPGELWYQVAGNPGPSTLLTGILAYYEVCENLSSPDWKQNFSLSGLAPYAWNHRNLQYVCYDNPRSLTAKAKYVLDTGLAGVMFWTLDFDDFRGQSCKAGRYPLLRQVKAVLNSDLESAVSPWAQKTKVPNSDILEFGMPILPAWPPKQISRRTQATKAKIAEATSNKTSKPHLPQPSWINSGTLNTSTISSVIDSTTIQTQISQTSRMDSVSTNTSTVGLLEVKETNPAIIKTTPALLPQASRIKSYVKEIANRLPLATKSNATRTIAAISSPQTMRSISMPSLPGVTKAHAPSETSRLWRVRNTYSPTNTSNSQITQTKNADNTIKSSSTVSPQPVHNAPRKKILASRLFLPTGPSGTIKKAGLRREPEAVKTNTTTEKTTISVNTNSTATRSSRTKTSHITACPRFHCQASFGFFQDLSSCSHFYSCTFWAVKRTACPPALTFDPQLRMCNWSSSSTCEVTC